MKATYIIPNITAKSLRDGAVGVIEKRHRGEDGQVFAELAVQRPTTPEAMGAAAADAVSRSVLVKVALPAGTARSGQFARLQVTTGAEIPTAEPVERTPRLLKQMELIEEAQGLRAKAQGLSRALGLLGP